MTTQPLSQTPRLGLNTATIGLILAIAIQFAMLVANGARVEAQVSDLRATTEPLRRGDLVAIQRDVSWIRENMERERAK
tara:strand:- start:4423 stop:4659 length:237 start_codon:yes stop_codon:yes gene_type:complete